MKSEISPARVRRQVNFEEEVVPEYGSDAIAQYVRDLGFEYVAMNPGASYRGLHDSFVNYLGNESPQMIVCLHEEHAVAIAHGYAKVTGRPMLVALHTNVGLMHASMAIFNAWCDRVPVVVLGSNGPVDASKRRPWIDWLHTTADQAAPVRQFIKWDDEPRSIISAAESLVRATSLAEQLPAGPTYVAFDARLQEDHLSDEEIPHIRRMEVLDPMPDAESLQRLYDQLAQATLPVLLFGRLSSNENAWRARVAFAERFGAQVITDLRANATFPTSHPLHVGSPELSMSTAAREALRNSDLIVALNAVDLAGSLVQAGTPARGDRKVVSITLDPYVHNGWSKDHQGLRADAQVLLGDPDRAVSWILDEVPSKHNSDSRTRVGVQRLVRDGSRSEPLAGEGMPIASVAEVVHEEFSDGLTTFVRLPIGWPGSAVRLEHPLDFLGADGGAGVGSGPGLAVGAALGLRGSGRLPLAVLGDGDFLMGCTALWSAAAEELGLLVVIANNRAYFNDELHQEHMALNRGRDVTNAWVGQRIEDPAVDLLAIARAQGAETYGPVESLEVLKSTLQLAGVRARAGHLVVVDVAVRREYDADAASTIAP